MLEKKKDIFLRTESRNVLHAILDLFVSDPLIKDLSLAYLDVMVEIEMVLRIKETEYTSQEMFVQDFIKGNEILLEKFNIAKEVCKKMMFAQVEKMNLWKERELNSSL